MSHPASTPAGAAPAAAPPQQCLTFLLGAEMFALDIDKVREIIQHGAVTRVPLMPGFLSGVMNLRGAVVPVIDVQARFGRAPSPVGKKTCIVVYDLAVGGQHTPLGLRVDAVSEVIDIGALTLTPPPSFGAPIAPDHIRGITRLGSRFVVVLEPDRAFDVDDMVRLCALASDPVPA